MQLEKELFEKIPGIGQRVLGRHLVFAFVAQSGDFRIQHLMKIDRDRAFNVCVRSGYDDATAIAILDAIDAIDWNAAPRDLVSVRPFQSTTRKFETLVHVPPMIARRFSGVSDPLTAAMSFVFPAYRCEIRNNMHGFDYDEGITKAQVPVIAWDREPTPFVRAHVLDAWTGNPMASAVPEPMVIDELVTMMRTLPEEIVRVRLADVNDRSFTFTRRGNHFAARREGRETFADEEISIAIDALPERLRAFGRGADLIKPRN